MEIKLNMSPNYSIVFDSSEVLESAIVINEGVRLLVWVNGEPDPFETTMHTLDEAVEIVKKANSG